MARCAAGFFRANDPAPLMAPSRAVLSAIFATAARRMKQRRARCNDRPEHRRCYLRKRPSAPLTDTVNRIPFRTLCETV